MLPHGLAHPAFFPGYLYTSELPSDLQNTKSWDPLIDRVESMWTEDGDIDGPCIFLNWKNGINSVNTVEEVRQKAPQVVSCLLAGKVDGS